MRTELQNGNRNLPKNRILEWLTSRLLLIFERGLFALLYLLTRSTGFEMESDDVFSNEATKPRDPNSLDRKRAQIKSHMANDVRDRNRAISVPHVPGEKHTASNPVKDFISNFVNRKGPKKRSTIKRSVTTENVSDEKALVRHVGRGHTFIQHQLRNPTWCDCCGEFIWGLFKQCVRCKNCKYTCHRRCKEDVDLDCTGGWLYERMMSVDEVTMKTLHLVDQGEKRKEPFMLYTDSPTGSLLRVKIDEYNSSTTGLIMSMRTEDTYQGFIRVNMNLLRPIHIIEGERPLSIFQTAVKSKDDDDLNQKTSQRTSFFLPLETEKALHVTSETTVHQVIVALLKKFKVADNPRKFALFECYQEEDDHIILRRMSDFEKPLVLRLLWGGADLRHKFSLQENETGDIVWEVFSIPELQNFMKILDKEEEEHILQVEEKYRLYKERLEQALALVQPNQTVCDEEKPPSDESGETARL